MIGVESPAEGQKSIRDPCVEQWLQCSAEEHEVVEPRHVGILASLGGWRYMCRVGYKVSKLVVRPCVRRRQPYA